MKPAYLVVLAGCGLVTLSTASAASLSLSAQDLTPVHTCILSGYPSGAASEADSFVEQGAGGANESTHNYLYVQTGNGTNMRAYLSFSLSACTPIIPATATVTDAVLRIYAYTMPGNCRTDYVFRVGVGGSTYWPNSLTWTQTGITWTNQPAGGGTSINNPPTTQATASEEVGPGCTSGITTAGYATWTVTTDVQSFVTGSVTNDGWMIRDGTEGSATEHVYYRSNRFNTGGDEPQLVITYVDAT